MGEVTEDAVLAALRSITDPSRGVDLVSAGMVESVTVRGGNVGFTLLVDAHRGAALEPLLRQLATPLADNTPQPLLHSALADLVEHLQAQPSLAKDLSNAEPNNVELSDAQTAQLWLEHASNLGATLPLLLAISQQCQELQQLLHSRALLNAALAQLSAAQR